MSVRYLGRHAPLRARPSYRGRNPARLAQHMTDVNTKRQLVRVLTSEKAVEQLIAKARKLPPKITY